MRGGQLAKTPAFGPPRRGGVPIEARMWPAETADIGTRYPLGLRVLTPDWIPEMPEGRGRQAGQHPPQVGLIGDLPGLAHERLPRGGREAREKPALALGLHEPLHRGAPLRRDDIQHGLTVLRNEGVEIDEVPDTVWNAIGDTRDHDAARAAAHQDDVAEILVPQMIDDVFDVGIEA